MDILEELEETKKLIKISKKREEEFLKKVRILCTYLLDGKVKEKIEYYEITLKHPWYLSKNRYNNLFEIKRHNNLILSMIQENVSYFDYPEYEWKTNYYHIKHNQDLKDLILEIQTLLDVDLLEVKLDVLKEDV